MLPGSKRVLPSVATMREDGSHLAIVVDEYGRPRRQRHARRLVEGLIGDIRDDYHEPEPVTGYVIAQLGRIARVQADPGGRAGGVTAARHFSGSCPQFISE